MGRNRQENHEVFWYRSKGSPSPLISGIVHLSSNACCGGGSHACVSDAGRELRPEIARRTLASTILKIFWTLQRGGGASTRAFSPREDDRDGRKRTHLMECDVEQKIKGAFIAFANLLD